MLYGYYDDYSYIAVLKEDDDGNIIEYIEFDTEDEAYEYFYGNED